MLRQIASDQYMIDAEHGRLLAHQDWDQTESEHLRNLAAQEQLGQSTPAVRAHDNQIARFLARSCDEAIGWVLIRDMDTTAILALSLGKLAHPTKNALGRGFCAGVIVHDGIVSAALGWRGQ